MFRPRIGQVLKGKVNSVGDGHIGCLIAGLFNATVHKDDMGSGYIYDDSDADGMWMSSDARAEAVLASRKWAKEDGAGIHSAAAVSAKAGHKRARQEAAVAGDAAFNRILAANPETIKVGDTIVFRVAAISHSLGMVTLHGSFVDDHQQSTKPVRDPNAVAVPIRKPIQAAGAASASAAARPQADEILDDDLMEQDEDELALGGGQAAVGSGAGGGDDEAVDAEESSKKHKKDKKEKKEKKEKKHKERHE